MVRQDDLTDTFSALQRRCPIDLRRDRLTFMTKQVIRELPSPPDQSEDQEGNLSRQEALTLLGVKKETLYTYVSRGWIRSFPADNGRTRVFSRLDVERLRARSLARSGIGAVAGTVMRYGEPIISTRITEITPQGPRYRSRLAVELADKGSAFEAVAHWLWTGVWLNSHISWNDTPRFQPVPPLRQLGGRFDDFAKCMAGTVLALGQQAAEGEPSPRVRIVVVSIDQPRGRR